MKQKYVIITILMGLFIIAISGCTKKESTKDINASELYNNLSSANIFSEGMVALDDDTLSRLYEIDPTWLSEYYGMISGASTADELLILTVNETDKVEDVKDILENRIEDRKESFEGYAPAEVKKMEDAILKGYDNVIVYCVSGDNKQATKILNK